MDLFLTRAEVLPAGVFGQLFVPGHGWLHTVEEDWLNNIRSKSCIPAGKYVLKRTIYYRHGYETFEVTGVPGRSRILVHPANTEEDLEGCIGVGLRRGMIRVPVDEDTAVRNVLKEAVVASREAFRQFMGWMAMVDEASLTVSWGPGLP